jgi:hypothetical protein
MDNQALIFETISCLLIYVMYVCAVVVLPALIKRWRVWREPVVAETVTNASPSATVTLEAIGQAIAHSAADSEELDLDDPEQDWTYNYTMERRGSYVYMGNSINNMRKELQTKISSKNLRDYLRSSLSMNNLKPRSPGRDQEELSPKSFSPLSPRTISVQLYVTSDNPNYIRVSIEENDIFSVISVPTESCHSDTDSESEIELPVASVQPKKHVTIEENNDVDTFVSEALQQPMTPSVVPKPRDLWFRFLFLTEWYEMSWFVS